MSRDVEAIETEYMGVAYRSRTEAKWAVFFDFLNLEFCYEQYWFDLSSGQKYLPDFYIHEFNAYFEVKPSSEEIITEECVKARCLAHDLPKANVWLSIGAPSMDIANILPLSLWGHEKGIEEILQAEENRYMILEDRRDDEVYWLHSEFTEGSFAHSFMIGGRGQPTDHDRLPLLHKNVVGAYDKALNYKFE
jgi:hypothetical protein